MTHEATKEYKDPCTLLDKVELTDRIDLRTWKWNPSKLFMVKQCYLLFMNGGIKSIFGSIIWNILLALLL